MASLNIHSIKSVNSISTCSHKDGSKSFTVSLFCDNGFEPHREEVVFFAKTEAVPLFEKIFAVLQEKI